MKKIRRSDDILNFNFYHVEKDEKYLFKRIRNEKELLNTSIKDNSQRKNVKFEYNKVFDYIIQHLSISKNYNLEKAYCLIHDKSDILLFSNTKDFKIILSKYDKLCNEDIINQYLTSKNQCICYDAGIHLIAEQQEDYKMT